MIIEKDLMFNIIKLALEEDAVKNDITTNSLIEYDKSVVADLTSREPGIISGIEVFSETFKMVNGKIEFRIFKNDGDEIKAGDKIMEITGNESSILKAERTALNFLQRLSGIATMTNKYVLKIAPFKAVLLDTRKTTPGMRYLEKKAVRDGGGRNHRLNLEDMALIKDNHIKMAGSIAKAFEKVKENFPEKKIEIEVTNLVELKESLKLDIDMILLDNFSSEMTEKAVRLNNNKVKLEVSGNISMENIVEKAKTGVDFISVGALTHSFKSLDLSLNIRK